AEAIATNRLAVKIRRAALRSVDSLRTSPCNSPSSSRARRESSLGGMREILSRAVTKHFELSRRAVEIRDHGAVTFPRFAQVAHLARANALEAAAGNL